MLEGQSANSRVKVAIRVRPFIAKELADTEESCVRTMNKCQIVLGRDREFKFDRVFEQGSGQVEVYGECVHELVMRCFDGYNAAVLAYGQTGSNCHKSSQVERHTQWAHHMATRPATRTSASSPE